jgi:hypothetical protein
MRWEREESGTKPLEGVYLLALSLLVELLVRVALAPDSGSGPAGS